MDRSQGSRTEGSAYAFESDRLPPDIVERGDLMTHDWRPDLVAHAKLKERIAALDKDGIFPYTLPSLAAKPEEINDAATGLGLDLDAQHREFLSYANGWRAFYETSDLLSTEQLQQGEHVNRFNAWLAAAPPQAAEAGYRPGALLPISVDLEMPMFFAMYIVDGRVKEQVVWLDPSGVVDVFASFQEFFASMHLYTRRTLQDFQEGKFDLDDPDAAP